MSGKFGWVLLLLALGCGGESDPSDDHEQGGGSGDVGADSGGTELGEGGRESAAGDAGSPVDPARGGTTRGGASAGGAAIGGMETGGRASAGATQGGDDSGGRASGGDRQGGHNPGGESGTSGATEPPAGASSQGGEGRGGAVALGGSMPEVGGEAGSGGSMPEVGGEAGSGGSMPEVGGEAGSGGEATVPGERSQMSQCGGLDRLASSDYCSVSALSFVCNEALPGLKLQLRRVNYQCCARLEARLVEEPAGYRLVIEDTSSDLCNCICVFDVELWRPDVPCEETTITLDSVAYQLDLTANRGTLLVSDEPAVVCPEPVPTDPEDIVAHFAGASAELEVTREWNRATGDFDPWDVEYDPVAQTISYQISISADGESVTITDPTGNVFGGTRVEADNLAYELTAWAGGRLEISFDGSKYVASLMEYGSGMPLIGAFIGVVTLTQ